MFKKFKKKSLRVDLVGLQNSGKNTILHNLKINQSITKVIAVGPGFAYNEFQFQKLTIMVWNLDSEPRNSYTR